MELLDKVDKVVEWLNDYVVKNEIRTLVIGVSGGIDSAVAFRIAMRTSQAVIPIYMPMTIHERRDIINLRKVTELCHLYPDIVLCIHEIGSIVDAYQNVGFKSIGLAKANLQSRVRANILYNYANMYRGLVVGTGNKDEDTIGYFTKGGDGLVDICPLSDIHKSEVYKIAELLNVPSSIINSVPTAGLWDGQTDEEELGMTYDEIEWAIKYRDGLPCDEDIDEKILYKVDTMRAKNRHKLESPPIFLWSGL